MYDFQQSVLIADRTHDRSLREAVEDEYEVASDELATLSIFRARWHYCGSDCAPFVMYMRWQSHILTLADITGDGERTGRMTPLLDELEAFATDRNFTLRAESVVNPDIMRFLLRRGYTISPSSPNDLLFDGPADPTEGQ